MRRLALLCCLLPVLVVPGLAACGQDEATMSTLGDVEVEPGGDGEAPQLEFDPPLEVSTTDSRTITEAPADAPAVESGQVVSMRYVGVNGSSGRQFDENGFTTDPVTFVLDSTVIKGFTTGLDGARVGSEVLIGVAPQDGYGPQGGNEGAGIAPDDTLLFLVEVVGSSPARAQGEPQPLVEGDPTVTLGERGEPTITIPAGTPPPDELQVRPLIRGDGDLVEEGQTITAHYTGVKWADGAPFDTSWGEGRSPGSFRIGVQQVIPGWDQGLVGQPVGSQVLLIVPPGAGYGPDGNPDAGISGDDTLVFVVDILAAA